MEVEEKMIKPHNVMEDYETFYILGLLTFKKNDMPKNRKKNRRNNEAKVCLMVRFLFVKLEV